MATQEETGLKRKITEREEELSRMGLGDLIREKDKLFMKYHYIDFPDYTKIIEEINRRMTDYEERLSRLERKDARYYNGT
ncbi:MAG: hypothetical protein Q7S06_03495 [Nanoarchaeota archaeon]|nr:hypothetical protein [Nanoarchaeota archaeon]